MRYIVDTEDYPFDVKAIQVLGVGDNPEDGDPTVWSRILDVEEYEIAHECNNNDGLTIKQGNELAYDDGYRQGMDDIWDVAGRIVLPESMGGFNGDDIKKIFDVEGWEHRSIFKNMKAYEVIDRVKRFEDDLKVGDEVRKKDSDDKYIVEKIRDDEVMLWKPKDGLWEFYACSKSLLKKTGKHYPLEEILDEYNKN